MRIEVTDEIVPQDFHRGDADVSEVAFLDGVREVGLNAFRECPNLERIYVSGSVRKIGRCSFMLCKRLQNIEMAEGLEEIEKEAFWSCQMLQSVFFPRSILQIGAGAFSRCAALESIEGLDGKCVDCGAFDGTKYAENQARIRAEIERAALHASIARADVGMRESFSNMASILNRFGFRTGSGLPYAEPYGWRHGGYDVGIFGDKHVSLWFPHVSFDAGGYTNIMSKDGLSITERRVLTQEADCDNPAGNDWRRTAELLRRGIKTYRPTFAHVEGADDLSNKYRFLGVYEISEVKENSDGYDFVLVHHRVSTHFEYLNGLIIPVEQMLGI